jgi:hypothetical protein
MRKNLVCLLVLIALCNVVFSAEASLQITSYSSVPSEVYPGTFGYMQLTLENTGDTKAISPTAYYNLDGIRSSIITSEISSGSSAQMSIPFRIPQDAGGSIQLLKIDIYYSYQSGSSSPVKTTSLSVPLKVSQQKVLEVSTLSLDNPSIAPGEKVTLEVELKNTGGVINNLVVTSQENSSFSIYGTTQKVIGSIPLDSSVNASFTLLSSSSATAGVYNIPLVFTYQDALGSLVEQTLYAGPVSVLEASSQYRLYLEPLTPVEVGSEAVFRLTLKNTGTSTISAFVDMNSTDVFIPIGVQKIYFDSVAPGSSVSTNISVGIAASKSAGYYSFPLKLTPSTGQPITYNTGVVVDATPELMINLETLSSGSKRVQIANTGNTAVRSVYVTARPKGSSSGATESFLGTLNVDDYETVDLSSASSGTIEVQINFRDSNNIQHTVTKDLSTGSNSNFTGGVTGNQSRLNGSAGQFGQRGGGIFGLNLQSPDLGQIAITLGGLVLLIVGAWFAYKRFWKTRKER